MWIFAGRLFPSCIEKNLYLGNWGVASEKKVFQCLKITHVVNCTPDHPNCFENQKSKSSSLDGKFDFNLFQSISLFSSIRVIAVVDLDYSYITCGVNNQFFVQN